MIPATVEGAYKGIAFSRLQPERHELWPAPGVVSQDRVAIVGDAHVMFLFGGSNGYYRSYFRLDDENRASEWAALTMRRHDILCKQFTACLSVFIPNKATCLPDLYPLFRPFPVSPGYRLLADLLSGDYGAVFCRSLAEEDRDHGALPADYWRLVDSHLSELGAVRVVNEVLVKLGLSPIAVVTQQVSHVNYGDLSGRWGPNHLAEASSTCLWTSLPAPELVSDSGFGTPDGASIGRRVTWSNSLASVPAHLLVVGNSFAGVGTSTTHLVWWLSRVFSRVTFLHSPDIPLDIRARIPADIIVFQGVERFLSQVPQDEMTLADLEKQFADRLSSLPPPNQPSQVLGH